VFRKHLDLSMLKDAGEADVDARSPSEDYLEELRDQRWDTLPTLSAKVENLNRRMRRLETKPEDWKGKAKRVARIIATGVIVAGSAAGGIGEVVKNYRLQTVPSAEQPPSLNKFASTALDRVPNPDAGTR
jgi:hypothetical protein